MPSLSPMARARRWSSTIRAARCSRLTVFSTFSPTIPSVSRGGGYTAARALATPSPGRMHRSTEREFDEQKETVEAEKGRQNGDAAAKPQQSPRGADDADRAQDDRDLKERAAVVEAEVAALSQVALPLEPASLGQELLLAGAVCRLTLEMLDARVVVGDPFLDGRALRRG